MKAALAAVLTGFQGLEHNDVREKPVDRLGALGMIQRQRDEQSAHGKRVDREAALSSLGVELIRFKGAHVASAKADAEDKLAGIMAWRSWGLDLTGKQRAIVAAWAIREWAVDICPTCAGAREVRDHDQHDQVGTQPMKRCPSCLGTSKRRYSDEERTAAMGSAFSDAMFRAHEIIGRAEALAVERAKGMLERWV